MKEVEECLGNLRTLLETYEFSDEANQHLALCSLQVIVVSNFLFHSLLGGPWDLVTTYSWDYNPTFNWGNPYKPV